jgi:fructose-bisphosphate aldolase class I
VTTNFQNLEATAKALVADGKGILAADETVGTLSKRFEKLKIPSTAESRRDYREMLSQHPDPETSSAVSSCSTRPSASKALKVRHSRTLL